MENKEIEVLSKDYVLANGVNFEDSLYYGGKYGEFIVEYDEKGEEVQFNGIAYDLFPNGNIDGYMSIKEGIKDGKMVDFYSNGKDKRIGNFSVNVAFGQQIEYFENGKVKSNIEAINGRRMKYIIYDEDGTIIEEKKEPTEEDLEFAEKWK